MFKKLLIVGMFVGALAFASSIDVRGPGATSSSPSFVGVCFNGSTTNCFTESGNIVSWGGNNGLSASILRGSGNTPFVLSATGDDFIYASDTNGRIILSTNISAANAGATVSTAHVKVWPQAALDATDWVFAVATINGTTDLFHVTYAGDVAASGSITGTGTAGLNLASPGARLTWTSSGRYIAANEATGDLALNSFGLALGNNRIIGAAAPTISSGFGTSPSIVASNGSVAFEVNVGTGGVATSGVIGLPAATTGWNCQCSDITTPGANMTRQTASSTSSCTVSNVAMSTGAAAAWTASDKLRCIAMAY